MNTSSRPYPYSNTLFDSLPVGIVFQDAKGHIASANPAAETILGLSFDEMRGVTSVDPRWRAIHEDGSPFPGDTHPAMIALKTQRAVLDVVMGVFNPKIEAQTWINIRAFPVRDAGESSVRGVYTLFEDISERKRLEHEADQYVRFFRLSTDAMCIADPFGCFKQINPAFAQLTGYSDSELLAKPFLDFVLPEDRQGTAEEMKLQVAVRPSLKFENRYVCKDGGVILLSWTAYFDKSDGVTYATARDITALRQAEERLEKFFALVPDLMCIATVDGRFLKINPAWTAVLGYTEQELLSTPLMEFVHPEDKEATNNAMRRQLAGEPILNFVNRYRCKDGSYRWLEWRTTPALDRTLIFATTRDITERKQIEGQIHQMAFNDMLTGLPNRRLLEDRLRQSMAASKRNGFFGALMFLDLDNFKLLNDAHGHDVGDLLLIEAAKRLKSCVREVDTAARFGGDEFVVMISELSADQAGSTAQAGVIARKVRAALAKPYALQVRRAGAAETTVEHQCTASIGVALFGKNEASPNDVLKWADAAMYQAKEAGCNLIRFHG